LKDLKSKPAFTLIREAYEELNPEYIPRDVEEVA
jgi:hypothetical protein